MTVARGGGFVGWRRQLIHQFETQKGNLGGHEVGSAVLGLIIIIMAKDLLPFGCCFEEILGRLVDQRNEAIILLNQVGASSLQTLPRSLHLPIPLVYGWKVEILQDSVS